MSDLPLGYHHLNLPADVFLAQVAGGMSALHDIRVERPSQSNVTIHHRYTPGWAIVVGILGLFVFLLGALLFFIKRTDTVSVIAENDPSGCNVTVTGKGPPHVGALLAQLVHGEAEKNYVAATQPVAV